MACCDTEPFHRRRFRHRLRARGCRHCRVAGGAAHRRRADVAVSVGRAARGAAGKRLRLSRDQRAGIQGDPGWVVIDEFAGQWITLVPLHHLSAVGLILAFVLFRFFDITKLGPVGWADRQHGAFGVMADDVIAGAIAALCSCSVALSGQRPGCFGG